MASSEMGATPVRSPGWPASPNELLKYEPSTVMLFIRLSWPAKLPPNPEPEYSGASRATSLMRPEIVGSDPSCSRSTAVEDPVWLELKMMSLWPLTVTVSATEATASPNSRSCVTPSVSRMSDFSSDLNPDNAAVTV